ncbi:MAG: FAD-binding protein [Thiolinea sp.]
MYDVLVIGSGAAGLTLALGLPQQCRVAVLSKSSVSEGSTVYAQGGVSAVLDEQDSIASHVEDTLDAGGRLVRPGGGALYRGKRGGRDSLVAGLRGAVHP